MNTVLLLIIIVTVAIPLWRWWLLTHPRVRCPWCKGSGENRLGTKNHKGTCKHCGGSGKRRSRLLGK